MKKALAAYIMRIFGEVSEWLKEQPWKGCVGFIPTKGSNPFLSVFCIAAGLWHSDEELNYEGVGNSEK